MKKNIIPAILFFAVLTVSVKLSAANRPADEQDKVIDKVQYRIIYQTKSVSDTASRDSTGAYQYDTDEMRLDIGTKISRFYSYINEHYDSLLDKYAERGDVQVLPDSEAGSLQWVVYKNFPDGKTQVLDNVFIDEFKIIEPTQQPEWQMVEGACQPKWEVIADSVVTILGYKCQMARTRFKGSGMVGMVRRRHSARQRSVEAVRSARPDTPCLRFGAAIYVRGRRIAATEGHRRHRV